MTHHILAVCMVDVARQLARLRSKLCYYQALYEHRDPSYGLARRLNRCSVDEGRDPILARTGFSGPGRGRQIPAGGPGRRPGGLPPRRLTGRGGPAGAITPVAAGGYAGSYLRSGFPRAGVRSGRRRRPGHTAHMRTSGRSSGGLHWRPVGPGRIFDAGLLWAASAIPTRSPSRRPMWHNGQKGGGDNAQR